MTTNKASRFKGGGRYSVIPAAAVYDPNLKPSDLQVIAAIGHHTDRDGWCYFNQSTLALACGLHRVTVNECIKRLTVQGYLEHHDINRDKPGARMDSIHVYRVLMDRKSSPSADLIAAAEADYASETEEIQVSPQDYTRCSPATTPAVASGLQHKRPPKNDPLKTVDSTDRPASPKRRKKQGELLSSEAEKQEERQGQRLMDAARSEEDEAFRLFKGLANKLKQPYPPKFTPKNRERLRKVLNLEGDWPQADGSVRFGRLGLTGWFRVLNRMEKSSLCRGEVKNSAGDPFELRFAYVASEDGITEILCGVFDDRKKGKLSLVGGASVVVLAPEDTPREKWVQRLQIWNYKGRERSAWEPEWHGAPGEPNCFVPADLLKLEGVA